MLKPLDRCQGDSTAFQFCARRLRAFIAPDRIWPTTCLISRVSRQSLLILCAVGILLLTGCEPYIAQFMTQGDLPFDTSRTVSWTKDGKAILFTYRQNIFVVDSEGRAVSKWLPEDAPIGEESFVESAIGVDLSPDENPVTGRIAYTTFRHADGDASDSYEIVSANFDRSGYRRLTESKGLDLKPAWSPDGSQIAFTSNRVGMLRLDGKRLFGRFDNNTYVMHADGSDLRPVAPSVFVGQNGPVWAPDGTRVAIRAWDGDLHTVMPNGGRMVHLGKAQGPPAWSPSGHRIAFVGKTLTPDGQEQETIFIADPDGYDESWWPLPPRPVRSLSGSCGSMELENLTWSLDGTFLMFTGFFEIKWTPGAAGRCFNDEKRTVYARVWYRIRPNGSGGEVLFRARPRPVAWSLDMGNLAYLHDQRGGVEVDEPIVSVMSADGSAERVLVKMGPHGEPVVNIPE